MFRTPIGHASFLVSAASVQRTSLTPRAARYGVRLTSDDFATVREDPDLGLAYHALRDELDDVDRDVLDGLLDGRTTRDLGAELHLSSSSITRRTAFIRAKAAKHLYAPRTATPIAHPV